MKIAVPVTGNNNIDDHFGHCEFYNVYTITENKEIAEVKRVNSPDGCGCKSDIASTLASEGVSVMLAGGIGAGAINVLNYNGIEVVRGCSGNASENVRMYINGLLHDSGSSCRQHETHHHSGHGCNHN
ncbi:MAG TPA: NifB/NifX family molybdenum-iron cluster-binding protein [Bacteroidales bacterium]|jgi:predicted Fe-Mo cluster-binding NifX family protein|nr:NifB/NifX family molybdenum-iron cluster-binding protein [Bacteroidales bacterium]